MFSVILQQAGTDWKLGGLYIKAAQVAGHDSDWFLARAREYKTKGQLHNAWFYYVGSPQPDLAAALHEHRWPPTSSTTNRKAAQPADLPAERQNDGSLRWQPLPTNSPHVFPEAVGNDLDLIVKYQAADVSNTNLAYQNNVAVIKALVTKYPEVRDAFAGVVARAVDPSGRDYGTLLAMKDVK